MERIITQGGLINGGMVNAGHRLVNAGLIRTTASFNVMDLPGLAVWLKADALGLSNDDPVSTFTDQSGNGHSPAQSGAARPIFKTNVLNGLPVVRFTKSTHWMTCTGWAISAGSNLSLFLVSKQSDTAAEVKCPVAHFWNGNPDGGFLFYNYGDYLGVQTGVGGAWQSGCNLAVTGAGTTFHYADAIIHTTSSVFGFDGSETTDATKGAVGGLDTNKAFDLGRNFVSPYSYWGGDLAEFIACIGDLSAPLVASTRSYLAAKYAL